MKIDARSHEAALRDRHAAVRVVAPQHHGDRRDAEAVGAAAAIESDIGAGWRRRHRHLFELVVDQRRAARQQHCCEHDECASHAAISRTSRSMMSFGSVSS